MRVPAHASASRSAPRRRCPARYPRARLRRRRATAHRRSGGAPAIERRMCGMSGATRFRNGPMRIHRFWIVASVSSLAPCRVDARCGTRSCCADRRAASPASTWASMSSKMRCTAARCVVRHARRRALRDAAFQRDAHVAQFFEQVERHRRDHQRAAGAVDQRAFRLQTRERGAHGHRRRADRFRDAAQAQRLAGREAAAHDRLAQLLIDAVAIVSRATSSSAGKSVVERVATILPPYFRSAAARVRVRVTCDHTCMTKVSDARPRESTSNC